MALTSGQQVSRLTSLKRLSLACEVAVLLQDWDLVLRGVWRAYHLLLPLLEIPAVGRILFQARLVLTKRSLPMMTLFVELDVCDDPGLSALSWVLLLGSIDTSVQVIHLINCSYSLSP